MTTQPPDKQATRLEKAREYKLLHAEEIRAWQKRYNEEILADPVRKARKNALNRKSAKRNYAKRKAYDVQRDPLKQKARAAVRHAIADGKLKREPCEQCREPKSQAHHDDYSKPFDVRWLCAKHHKEIHNV